MRGSQSARAGRAAELLAPLDPLSSARRSSTADMDAHASYSHDTRPHAVQNASESLWQMRSIDRCEHTAMIMIRPPRLMLTFS